MYGGGYGAGYRPMGGRTVGVDVNGDGIADYRTGARVQPGPGMAMGRPGYGAPGYGAPGYGAPGYRY